MRLSKLLNSMNEMARPKGEAIRATLNWAAHQKGEFTVKDLYKVYTANGGRANTAGENLQSFSTQIMKYVAQPWRDGEAAEVSDQRPILAFHQGSRGAGNPHRMKWAWNPPSDDDTNFVDPHSEEPTAGDAMDRLEKAMSRMGKGLPDDPAEGKKRLKAAMARWKAMKSLNQVVADIRATVPAKGQMDALHIASEFLIDRGAADEEDVDDAEDKVAHTPTQAEPEEEPDDLGDFSDEPEEEPEEEPATPAPTFQRTPAARPSQPEPEPEDEEEPEDDDTEQQAGAQNFLQPPPKPQTPARSPVSKFFKKR